MVLQPKRILAEFRVAKVEESLDAIGHCLGLVATHFGELRPMQGVPVGPGGTRRFVTNAVPIVRSLQFVEQLVDPSGQTKVTDLGMAEKFLQRLGVQVTRERVTQIFDLRELAQEWRDIETRSVT